MKLFTGFLKVKINVYSSYELDNDVAVSDDSSVYSLGQLEKIEGSVFLKHFVQEHGNAHISENVRSGKLNDWKIGSIGADFKELFEVFVGRVIEEGKRQYIK